MFGCFFQFSIATRSAFFVALLALLIVPLAGCDLAKNYTKIDRSSDMEFQDYRDAMAPRLPESNKDSQKSASIPDFKPYIAQPTDTLKPMPLVSISVNQTVPLRDALFELAQQADYDIELDPRIRGSIIFTARNRPFDEVIERITETAGLRYKFDNDSLKVELDSPYHKIYKVNFLNFVRTKSSSVSSNISVVSGEGAEAGSKFSTETTSNSDFWAEMDVSIKQILELNRDVANLKTANDPRITASPETLAPVEPVLLTSGGEVRPQASGIGATNAAGQQLSQQPNVQVQPPNTILRVQPLPIDEEDQTDSSDQSEGFRATYSINKQAGIVSVFANERTHKKVASYLDALKKSTTTQVLIEAKVLEVSLSDEFSSGVNWRLFSQWLDEGLPKRFFGGAVTSGTNIAPLLDPAPNTPFSLIGLYESSDVDLGVEILNRFGTVRALASPRLTVLNNQSAVLNVARNLVYFEIEITREEGTVDSPGERTEIESDAKTVPEGVLINVQPSIDYENKTISMAVRPTVTKVFDFINDPGVAFIAAELDLDEADRIVSRVPVVDIQEFDSIVQMNDGQPIVLGGLINDRSVSTQNGVPGLGETPIVGSLFRNQSDRIQKTELVIFLKATIIEGNTGTIHDTDKDIYRSFSQDRRPFDL